MNNGKSGFERVSPTSGRVMMRPAIRQAVCEYVDKHLGEEELTAEHVLGMLNVPRATLYRTFEADGGVASYIRMRRLEAAVSDLIRFPALQISEIAFAWGFASASSFTRAFRRKFDISPQQMRLAGESVVSKSYVAASTAEYSSARVNVGCPI